MTQRKAVYTLRPVGIAAPVETREFGSRRDLVVWINATLDRNGFSSRARRQVNVEYLWRMIQTHGASACPFRIECPSRPGVALRFIGR